jgi:hypothetical protein
MIRDETLLKGTGETATGRRSSYAAELAVGSARRSWYLSEERQLPLPRPMGAILTRGFQLLKCAQRNRSDESIGPGNSNVAEVW